jgi:hypothetical protein
MTTSSPHIVCFAPYTDWSMHSARQVTILHGLRLRGATVSYVTCDGVFSDCDLFQKSTGAAQAKQSNSCQVCQSSVAARLAAWNMPIRWLGRWLSTTDFEEAGRIQTHGTTTPVLSISRTNGPFAKEMAFKSRGARYSANS